MRVFVLGATGYIGRGVTRALLKAGHAVTALARSPASVAKLPAGDVSVLSGDVANLDAVRAGVQSADAVIYNAIGGTGDELDAHGRALDLIIEGLSGSNKPLIVTSGLGVYIGGTAALVDEDDDLAQAPPQQGWRVNMEKKVVGAASRGVRTIVIRPSWIYGGDSANRIFEVLIGDAKARGSALYVGEGDNMMPVAHVDDLARAYLLALEKAAPGSIFNIASLLTGKDVARAVSFAAGLGGKISVATIEEARAAVGPMAAVAIGSDMKVSGFKAAAALGWWPAEASLLHELTHGVLGSSARS